MAIVGDYDPQAGLPGLPGMPAGLPQLPAPSRSEALAQALRNYSRQPPKLRSRGGFTLAQPMQGFQKMRGPGQGREVDPTEAT